MFFAQNLRHMNNIIYFTNRFVKVLEIILEGYRERERERVDNLHNLSFLNSQWYSLNNGLLLEFMQPVLLFVIE